MHYFILPVGSVPLFFGFVHAQGRHAQTNAGHSRTRGPAQAPHALAGTRCPPTQADWQTQKQRQGTRRQVQSTRKQEGHAVQAPEPGEMRPSRMMARTSAVWVAGRGSYPKTCGCCQAHNRFPRPWLRNVSARAILIGYASRKWSSKARTDAPERAAGCPPTMPRGTAIRFRACIRRPCQRPGPLLEPYLPSSHPSMFAVI